jgi:Uma2 family endonuclease
LSDETINLMPTLIRDTMFEEVARAERKASGADRWDEVWEGTYVMAPLPNDEHQDIQTKLVAILQVAFGWAGLGDVRAGVNVSDREVGWMHNYRCPDVVAFLKETRAQNRDTFWLGGPDFAVEIVSPNDASRDKLEFYSSVGTRELLIIDRAPWQLELYRLNGARLSEVGRSAVSDSKVLSSEVVPLSFRLIAGGARPAIEVVHHDGVQRWTV